MLGKSVEFPYSRERIFEKSKPLSEDQMSLFYGFENMYVYERMFFVSNFLTGGTNHTASAQNVNALRKRSASLRITNRMLM